ncbi:MAG: LPS-assembly protein [Rhodospirillaceae bacterium]|nr:LPS-assembly protein [Rhodospirillaceae bacterium]
MRERCFRGWILAVVLLWAPCALAQKQPTPTKNPVLITADQVSYDRDLGVVVASGHVEVAQDDRVLTSDTLTYNERQKTVTASGHVSLKDATGNTVFADYMEVTDDLKNGIIKNIKMLLTDKSRIAANRAKRTGPVDSMDKAVYSPCKPCVQNPMRPPIWQLKADRIVHDNNSHMIEYHNAWMDIFGVPILYTPYFSHPDPTVKRKSGFLAPTFGGSSTLGLRFQLPYYWVTGPSSDLTITPIITSQANPVIAGRWRQRVNGGNMDISASATYGDQVQSAGNTPNPQSKFEGYLFGTGRFDLTDNWRWGFDVNRTSDPAYLQIYNFQHAYDRSLNSEVYGEGFDGRSYASIQAWSFQSMLSTDSQTQQPIVAPLINYNLVGEPNKFGAYWTLDAGAMVLSRVVGTDSRRITTNLGWTLPYTAPAGDIYKLRATVRADGYWVDDVGPNSTIQAPTGLTQSGFTGRFFPQLSFEWRYPFIRRSGSTSQVIEPIFSADIAPNSGNNSLIPNEDSLDFQFDETNIFNPDRFTGLDLVDNGQRINYGVKWSIYGDGGGHSSVLLGQSYQFNADNAFDAGAGLQSGLSDVVGAIGVSPNDYLNFLYRFRVDTRSFTFRRHEIGVQAGTPKFNIGIDYAFLDATINDGSTFGKQQEFYGIVQSQINDNWSVFARGRQDLETDLTLEWGGGITYKNDCITLQLVGLQQNYTTVNITPQTTVMLVIGFKNLGNYGVSF